MKGLFLRLNIVATWNPNTSSSCTLCNLLIAVTTLFIWLVRLSIMSFSRHTLDFYATITINALYDVVLAGLWIYSTSLQDSGDFSDPEHISLQPWYLERGCAEAWSSNQYGCKIMKWSYGLSVFAAYVDLHRLRGLVSKCSC
jgi:hypothetical protein